MKLALVAGLGCALAGAARGDLVALDLGTNPTPEWIGRWLMLPAPRDDRVFMDVTSVPGQAHTTITFSRPVNCREVGFGWATWSHGYTGNVYYAEGATSLGMTITGAPVHRGGFAFYVEPNPFGLFAVTATGTDGSASLSLVANVEGDSGARGFVFYTAGIDGPLGIESVNITADVDFAVGEFSTGYIPAPGGLVLAVALARRARR